MSTPALRFPADEGCDFAVVRALREAGFDVVAVCEIMPRSNDSYVIRLSHAENRVLLTEGKNFGWLVFVSHEDSAGVVLIRFPANARTPRLGSGMAGRWCAVPADRGSSVRGRSADQVQSRG